MSDIRIEDAFPLRRAAADKVLIAFNRGRRPNVASIWRWCKRGVSAKGGAVKLESRPGSRGLLTSHEAIVRFVDAVANAGGAANPSVSETPKKRGSVRDAERFCERQGA
jgi:hypothetical protein